MNNEKYAVSGMTCTACSAAVERAVKKLPGVEAVSVNLLQGQMGVSYDESSLTPGQIIGAVEAAGYGARPMDGAKAESAAPTSNADGDAKRVRLRLAVSIPCLVVLMVFSMGPMLGMPLPDSLHHNPMLLALIQLFLTLPIAIANGKYFTGGFKALLHRNPNMDSLVAIGSGAALVASVWTLFLMALTIPGGDHAHAMHLYHDNLYLESAATILTLITLGKYFEARSKGRTTDAIRMLINLAPKMATVERDGSETTVPIEDVQIGDVAVIRPGAAVSVDGTVIEGRSAIDQSALTGESIPVDVEVGSKVSAGTVNHGGLLRVNVTALSKDSTLSRIVQLVEEAGASKAPIGRLADKVSAVFVPVVIGIAVLATIAWLIAGKDIPFALSIGISVLVISCPCALGLATPVAIMVGTGRAAQMGVLFKSAEALETAHAVTRVAIDKTGTLTKGKPQVTDVIPFDMDEAEFLHLAASVEQPSEHPLARAVVQYAAERGIAIEKVAGFTALMGRGAEAEYRGEPCLAGSERLMREHNIDLGSLKDRGAQLMDAGKTVLFFAMGGKAAGLIAVADALKETSTRAIKAMVDIGVEPVMLTGDNERAAAGIAHQLGMTKYIAEVLPSGKDDQIQALQQDGAKVAMIGDGINDAPALTRADVGIAIGAGTDIAVESADVVLMKGDLMGAVDALRLGRSVIRNIKENLFWAFFYNVIGIPLAAGAFYHTFGWKLNPMIGAAAMSLSSVCVVMNALRLRRFKSMQTASVEPPVAKAGRQVTIHVEGMMCQNCVRHVKEALDSISGVNQVDVDLESGTANVTCSSDVTDQQLVDAVVAQDYGATI